MLYLFVAVLVVAVAIYIMIAYNQLIKLSTRLREAFAGMDVYLKRRYDLIPNLVDAVRAGTKYEGETLKDLAEARAGISQSGDARVRISGENRLSARLGEFHAVVESYPELRANEQFLKLQDELIRAEDDLVMARRYYNGVAKQLNVVVESFPSNLVAKLFRIKGAEMFQLSSPHEREDFRIGGIE